MQNANFYSDWTPDLAYIIGLITSDGNLSSDGRHISFTSKDKQLIEIFRDTLQLKNNITKKARAANTEKKYHLIQFGNVGFYQFLLDIGLCPNKSKVLTSLEIPDVFFYDFLRGYFDGDGNIHEFLHPESINPQLRIRICSGSELFLLWVQKTTLKLHGLKGHFTKAKRAYMLVYAMKESKVLLKLMYPENCEVFLQRKYKKAKKYLF